MLAYQNMNEAEARLLRQDLINYLKVGTPKNHLKDYQQVLTKILGEQL